VSLPCCDRENSVTNERKPTKQIKGQLPGNRDLAPIYRPTALLQNLQGAPHAPRVSVIIMQSDFFGRNLSPPKWPHRYQRPSINGINRDKKQLKKLFLTSMKLKKNQQSPIYTTNGHLLSYAHKYFTLFFNSVFY